MPILWEIFENCFVTYFRSQFGESAEWFADKCVEKVCLDVSHAESNIERRILNHEKRIETFSNYADDP